MSNYNDPEWREGVQEGVDRVTGLPGYLRKGFEWLVEKIDEAVGDWPEEGILSGGVSGDPPPRGGPLEDRTEEWIEEWRSTDPGNQVEEAGAMDVGRENFGVEVPISGRGEVAPVARPEVAPEAEESVPSAAVSVTPSTGGGEMMGSDAALMDAMRWGVNSDNMPYVIDALSNLVGQDILTPRGLGELNKLYNQKTGGSGGRTMEEFFEPSALEILLRG